MHRVLIVGGGSIGERHLRCFLKTGRAEVSVCDNRPERLKQLASAYPVAGTHADFDRINLSKFSAGVVCVPANLHVPWSLRMANAGLHVLCEKPISTSLDGVAELERVAREKRLTVGVAYVRRAMEISRVMKAQLAGGKIGPALHAIYCIGYDHRVARPDWRATYALARETGGGAINDIASHAVNILQWILGPIRSVCAVHDRLQYEDTDVEDTLALVLRFRDSAAIANLNVLLWQPFRTDSLTLSGPCGSLICDAWEGKVGTVVRGSDEWKWTTGLKGKSDDARGQVDAPFVAEAGNFMDAIEGKAAPLCTLAEARHTLEVCLAAFESGRSGRTVSLPANDDALGG